MRTRLEKATRQHTRDHNSRLVLQAVYDNAQISRADLSRQTGLTRTTISDVVSELIDQGFVEEVGQGPTSVGRTPTLLSIVETARSVLAVNTTASELHGAVVNLRGGIMYRDTLSVKGMNGSQVLELLPPFVDGLARAAASPILGIGISSPGLIDMTNGVVHQAVHFDWHDLPLRDLLQARYDLPVYVANDGHTVALSEYMFGQWDSGDNLIALKIGQGIGAGIVLEGKLFVGDKYGAGEIGHVVVEENGLPCKCGNAGCLETVASIPALIQRARLLADRDPHSLLHHFADENHTISLETVIQAFRAGDPAVRRIIIAIGRYLGVGIASMVATLGIRQVIISGRIAPFGKTLRDAIYDEVRRRVLPTLAQSTQIHVIAQGQDAVLLGTAALLLTSELGLTRLLQQGQRFSEVAA